MFPTIQKFLPLEENSSSNLTYNVKKENLTLSNRHNIVVIAYEAHRSQYDFTNGYAKHLREALPNATCIGFTGTPIEKADKNTKTVFGDYIHIYDIQQAIEDKAMCPFTMKVDLPKSIY